MSVAVNSLLVTCTWPQRVTFTQYLASFCTNLDLTQAFSPLPEQDNRKHSLVSVVTPSRATQASQAAPKSHRSRCVMPQQEASAEKHVHAPGCSSQQKEPLSPGGFHTTVPESTGIDSSSARKQDGAGKNRLGCSYLLCTSDLHWGAAFQRNLAFKKSTILKNLQTLDPSSVDSLNTQIIQKY